MPILKLDPRLEADVSLTRRQSTVDAASLPERWRRHERHVVLDTHFELGLNFLKTWRAWRADTDPQRARHLHYLAVESRPFTASAMTALHAAWPESAALSQELIQAWPTLVPGFHRVFLADETVSLTLMFGDLEECVAQIDAQVDTFYVDGKEVGQLPEKRATTLLTLLGRLAAPQAAMTIAPALSSETTLLKNTGFEFDADAVGRSARFAPRWKATPLRVVNAVNRHAIVIGAGVAGAAATERLCARGWQVTLIESHLQAAQEASGNRAGIFMPVLAKDDNPSARLARVAFLFALRTWRRLGGVGNAFSGEACGVVQLARDAARAKVAQEIADARRFPPEFARWLDAQALVNLPGMAERADAAHDHHGGWLFPQGGWAHPGGVCEALLAACGDKLHKIFSRKAVRIERDSGDWRLFDDHGLPIATASHVIVANGVGFREFQQTASLPLDRVRGQVTYLPAASLPDVPFALCREGYLTRPVDGDCILGASYDSDNDPHLRLDSQRENLARLEQILPHVSSAFTAMPLTGRVGFRCVSADRLPLVGALPDQSALAHFRGDRLRDVPRLPGLYGLLGYASRGLIWAPLAAELLAAHISGEPLPLERDLAATLDPARFCLAAQRRLHK